MTQEQRKMINLERILDEERSPFGVGEFNNRENEVIFNAMREAIRQALELAAENAEVNEGWNTGYSGSAASVNKQSIISVKELVK